jgi:hypothetical protein
MKIRQMLKMTDWLKGDCCPENGINPNMQVLDYIKGMFLFRLMKKSPSSMGVCPPRGETCFGLSL